jgi:hypothetical protein
MITLPQIGLDVAWYVYYSQDNKTNCAMYIKKGKAITVTGRGGL